MPRTKLEAGDWAHNRYLWVRLGYNYVCNHRGDGTTYHEDRGIGELSLRQPIAMGITLAERLKWDLSDIDGDYSNRYRAGGGLERAFEVGGHAVVPYAHAEVYYDTRYDAWNRQRDQAGVEIALNSRRRIEPFLARQDDSRPKPGHINVVGPILKYFH